MERKMCTRAYPTVLNRFGASDVLEIHMTPEELARFKESTKLIREYGASKSVNVHKLVMSIEVKTIQR